MKISFESGLKQGVRARGLLAAVIGLAIMGTAGNGYAELQVQKSPVAHLGGGDLARRLETGDVVFIRIPHAPFTKVSDTTSSWTNHVGIVTDVSGAEPKIAESRLPLSGETTWTRFVGRSEEGRVAVARLGARLDERQQSMLRRAVAARRGILYDTGFDLHSPRQFCSRFVREVLDEATGVRVGQIESFSTLLKHNPDADLSFWRTWYFGYIPWERQTVTPASLLNDAQLHIIFDGYAGTTNSNKGD